jgi:PIN domain nuclease of toxin-antitoxin system
MVLDTHAAIWYLSRMRQLSRVAAQAIRRTLRGGRPLYISAISIVETSYLVERGRLPPEALQRLDRELEEPAFGIQVVPVDARVAAAVRSISREIVPDMPDRIIAATALYLNVPLITRDARIQASGIRTIW